MTVTVDAPIDLSTITIDGYKRADGQVGIRNRLLVLFTVVCAEEVSRRIAEYVALLIIGPLVVVGRGTKDSWPKPGQLALEEVVIKNHF